MHAQIRRWNARARFMSRGTDRVIANPPRFLGIGLSSPREGLGVRARLALNFNSRAGLVIIRQTSQPWSLCWLAMQIAFQQVFHVGDGERFGQEGVRLD